MDDISIEITTRQGGYTVRATSIKSNPKYELLRRVKTYEKALNIGQEWFNFCKGFLDVGFVSLYDIRTDELQFWSRAEEENNE